MYLAPASLHEFLAACADYIATVLPRLGERQVTQLMGLMSGHPDHLDEANPLGYSSGYHEPHPWEVAQEARFQIARCIGRDRPEHNLEIADAVARLATSNAELYEHALSSVSP